MTDVIGATNTMMVALGLSGLALAGPIGAGTSAGNMTMAWVVAKAVAAAPYPALVTIAKDWFPASPGSTVGVRTIRCY